MKIKKYTLICSLILVLWMICAIIGRYVGKVSSPKTSISEIAMEPSSEINNAYGISMDIDVMKPLFDNFRKNYSANSKNYADIHIRVDGKDYTFTLNEFIERISIE